MTLQIIASYLAGFCLLAGAFFALVGAIGLLRFNDAMTRLHAPTKVGTLGIGSLLLASMLNSFAAGDGSLSKILIMGFLFVTAPISANFIAKVILHQRVSPPPPAPPRDSTWATFDTPGDEAAQ